MDRINNNFMHGMTCVVSVVVLVYGGQQIHIIDGLTQVLMKASGITSALSIVLLAISFFCANKSNCYSTRSDEYKQRALDSSQSIDARIDAAETKGFFQYLQSIHHRRNVVLTNLSIILLTVSVTLFGVTICLM